MSARRIPEWLRECENNEAEINEIARRRNPLENIFQSDIKNINRRSLRSSSFVQKPVEIPKELPFIEYKGCIRYLTDSVDIASACDDVLKWVDAQSSTKLPIAFDMEWPFSFQTGSGRTAVIQICAEENLCYVFHISQLRKIPAALNALLTHDKVILHGVNIKNDFRKLQRDFREISADKIETMIQQCVDLSTWCNKVCSTGGRWSLERLVRYICKLRINKNNKVRMSKWHVIPLSKEQQLYAAIDVYISQVIYGKLEKMEKEKDKRLSSFTEMHGEKSLQAIQALGVNFLNN